MKKVVLALLLAGSSTFSAYAQLAPPASTPITAQKRAEPNEADLQAHGHYRNKDGQEVHKPSKSVDDKVPAGASAKCRDGSYSFSRNHRGTCSHHGGVASWL